MTVSRFCLIFVFFVVTFSCAEKTDEELPVPTEVLSIEKMAEVIAHVHLAEAVLFQENLKPLEQRHQISFDVLSELKITKDVYQKSLQYYSMNPEKLKVIHEMALEKLNRMRQ
jgi:hypothetical protein